MASNKNSRNQNNKKYYAGWALATGAAAAMGAGAYYLLGPDKKKHQKKAKELLGKIKDEIVAEAVKAKSVGTPAYHRAAEAVARVYREQYKLHEKDIQAIARKLKDEWQQGKRQIKRSVKSKTKSTQGADKKKNNK